MWIVGKNTPGESRTTHGNGFSQTLKKLIVRVTPGSAHTFAFFPDFSWKVFAYLERSELMIEDFPTLGIPAIKNTAGIVLNFLKIL